MHTRKKQQHDSLCQQLGYEFREPSLLHEALTHRSHSIPHNERLEFLGDGVLNCAVAALIFRSFPELPEGRLSRLRANLVNQQALFELAVSLNLSSMIQLGEGELKSGGNRRPSILSDALEAVLGAIYLDSDFMKAEEVIVNLYRPLLDNINPKVSGKDPKTRLQELLQSKRLALPEYSVVNAEGEAHQQKFKVKCVVQEFNVYTFGEGTNRRSAEQAAAELAYKKVSGPR